VTDLNMETIDYIAIRRLQSAYADSVNRRAWSDFSDIFLPNASVTINTQSSPAMKFSGPVEIGNFIRDAIQGFDLFEFVVLNTVVNFLPAEDTKAKSATARVYMCEIRHEAATGRGSTAYGLYQDSYECANGQWRIAARLYQSIARTAPDLTILPPPTLL
jgi:hypothetical protein